MAINPARLPAATTTVQGAAILKGPTRQMLTAASGTYTTPAGCVAIIVEGVGGGGGGAGADQDGAGGSMGGGGAAGSFSSLRIVPPAASYAFACGAAGAAGAAGATGGLGGDTTFGAVLTAKGGAGGLAMALGSSVIGALGGNGQGSGNVGDITTFGDHGKQGLRYSATSGQAGAGASSLFGCGGYYRSGAGVGVAATGYGSGGGGAIVKGGTTSYVGGVGGAGVILVTEYY